VKFEFEGENGLPGEWMWVRVESSDEQQKLVFRKLDNDSVCDEWGLSVGLWPSATRKFESTRNAKNSQKTSLRSEELSNPWEGGSEGHSAFPDSRYLPSSPS
jgi:hypothetical protein